MRIFIFLFFLFVFLFLLIGQSHSLERDYIKEYCQKFKGIPEYTLSDKTRVDCLTNDYAIEFEFAEHWKESIAQSLHYSAATGKKAKIFVICKKPTDAVYASRLNYIIMYYQLPIEMESLGCSFKEK